MFVGLAETCKQTMTLSENILQTHKCFFLAAEKVKKYRRAMAGIWVYVKINFVKYVKRICEDCSSGIF